ncbi:MAG: DoxX family membrane protein [Wenzhouxiangellaceae bacterium]|nr:DoxX family membrane protein [Wenzhouxiangellaceae bacterium]
MFAINALTPRQTALFICRWVLGLLFAMAGWWKVFELGALEHARQFFVQGFAESWIPEWLLWALGSFIPYLELVAGLLILLGLKLRWALTAVGLLLIVTTYGHALQQPLFNIDGHTFTRLALIVLLLMGDQGHDWTRADFWLERRASPAAV